MVNEQEMQALLSGNPIEPGIPGGGQQIEPLERQLERPPTPVQPPMQAPAMAPEMAQISPPDVGQLPAMPAPASPVDGLFLDPTALDQYVEPNVATVPTGGVGGPLGMVSGDVLNGLLEQPGDTYWDTITKAGMRGGARLLSSVDRALYSFWDTLYQRPENEQQAFAENVAQIGQRLAASHPDPMMQPLEGMHTPMMSALQDVTKAPDTFAMSPTQELQVNAEMAAKRKETRDKVAGELAIFQEMQKDYAANVDPLSVKGLLGSTVEGLTGSVLPMAAVAVVNPTAALAYLGTDVFTETYVDSRMVRNRSPYEALADGSFKTLAEVLPEGLVLGEVMKKGRPLLNRVISGVVAEGMQEGFTEILDTAYDTGILGDNISLKDAAKRIANAAITGGVSGGIMGGIYHPVDQARRNYAREKLGAQYEDVLDSLQKEVPGSEFIPSLKAWNKTTGEAEVMPINALDLHRFDAIVALEELAKNQVDAGELAPDKYVKVMDTLKAQRQALRKKMEIRVDAGGQLTLPGFGTQKHVNEQAANMAVPLNQMTDADVHELKEAPTQQFYDMMQRVPNAEIVLNKTGLKGWTGGGQYKNLAESAQMRFQDKVQWNKVQDALNMLYPDSEYIPVFVGHDWSFSKVLRDGAGNASLSPTTAWQFSKNAGMPTTSYTSHNFSEKGPPVSVLMIPKKSVAFVVKDVMSEMEVVYFPEQAKYLGFYYPQNEHGNHVVKKGAPPPLLQGTQQELGENKPGIQFTLPGFGPQQQAPVKNIDPVQYELPLFEMMQQKLFSQRQVYHASPYTYVKPAPVNMGKGEGAYAEHKGSYRGRGFYVGEAPGTAKHYKEKTAQFHLGDDSLGHIYTMEIPEDAIDTMVQWDKPYGEQPQIVQDFFNLNPDLVLDGPTFEAGLEKLLHERNDVEQRMLRSGIMGIKFLDKLSKPKGKGTYNYTLFDHNLAVTIQRDGVDITYDDFMKDTLYKDITPAGDGVETLGDAPVDAVAKAVSDFYETKRQDWLQQTEYFTTVSSDKSAYSTNLKQLEDVADRIVKQFLPGYTAEIFFISHPDEKSELMLNSQDNKLAIGIDADSIGTDVAAAYEAMVHEFGHAIARVHIETLNSQQKQDLLNAYNSWRMTHVEMDEDPDTGDQWEQYGPEAAQSVMLPQQMELYQSAYDYHVANGTPTTDPGGLLSYFDNWDEWVAQQIARYITVKGFKTGDMFTMQYPGQQQNSTLGPWVEHFMDLKHIWKNIAKKISALYADAFQDHTHALMNTSLFDPNVVIAKFLETATYNGQYDQALKKSGIYTAFLKSRPKTLTQMHQLLRQAAQNSTAAASRLSAEFDLYTTMIGKTWNLLQIARKNAHVRGLVEYKEAIDYWHNTRMKWIAEADAIVKDWKQFNKKEGDALARFLFDLTELNWLPQGQKPRQPTPQELQQLAQKWNLTPAALQFYVGKIRPIFNKVLATAEAVEISDARRNISDPVVLQQRIAEIQASYAELRNRPYFPLQRFGDFTVVVRDLAGKVIHVEAFETEIARDRAYPRIEAQFPGMMIRKDKFAKDIRIWRAMPPSMVQNIASRLNLNATQHGQLEELLFEFSPARGFKKHFAHREKVGGYHQDAMRSFADYFFHGANHLARVEHAHAMDMALQQLQEGLKDLRNANADATKRQQLVDWVNDHYKYIMEPKNELAALRSAGFMWYLGFVPRAAAVNLMQLPMVTYPHLASRFGVTEATRTLSWAMSHMRQNYGKGNIQALDPSFFKGLQFAIDQGWMDESMASDLAATAEGGLLQRFLPGTEAQRTLAAAARGAAFMFHEAERLNRRITFRAAWELAKRNPNAPYLQEVQLQNPRQLSQLLAMGWNLSEATAFLAAKDAVQATHFEYAGYNRGEIFRGKKSVILLFKSYLQNMLWFFRHDEAGKWSLLLFLLASGLTGLPFADDLIAVIKAIAGVDLEEKLRELLVALGSDHPDLYLHGAGRYTFGLPHLAHMIGIPGIPEVDVSSSLGFGNVVPGLSEINQGTTFADKFAAVGTAITGPVGGIPINAMKAWLDPNPDRAKAWERAMPTALRNVARSFRYLQEGQESSSNGATVVHFDAQDSEQLAEIGAQALGFTSTRLAQKWDYIRAQQERMEYFQTRREVLMRSFDYAYRNGDEDAQNSILDKVASFNAEVPDARLAISGKTLVQSLKQREQARMLMSQGLPAQKAFWLTADQLKEQFPEIEPAP